MKIFLTSLLFLCFALGSGSARAAVEAGEDTAAHISRNLSVIEERKKTAAAQHEARLAEEARINARIDRINALSARQLDRWYASDRSDAALELIAATPDKVVSPDKTDTNTPRTQGEQSDTFRQLRLLLIAILGIALFCYWTWRRRRPE